jgi:O-antigen/teichoic acid export membrane protein
MNLRHTTVYAASQAITAIVGFLGLLAYTRILTPSEYGAYAVCMAVVQMSYVALYGWLGASVNRFYPVVTDGNRRSFLTTLGWSFAFVSLVSVLIVLAGSIFVRSDEWRPFLVPCLALLIGWAGLETVLSITRAELAPARFTVASVGRAAIGLGAGASLALAGWGPRGVLMGLTVGCCVPVALEVLRHRRYLAAAVPDRELTRAFAAYGFPVAASFVLEWVLSSSDRVLLTWLADTRSTGLYATAYSLAQQAVQTGPVVITLAMYPVVVRAFEQPGREELRRHLESTLCGILGLSVPAAVGLWLLTPNVAASLLGRDFHVLSPVVVGAVAAGVVLSSLRTGYVSVVFLLTRRTGSLIWPLLAGGVTNIILNLVGIPRWGAVGAAWATLLAYGVALFVSVRLARRVHPMPWPMAQLARIGFCTLGMSLVVQILAKGRGIQALALQVGAGVCAYTLLFVALNVMGSRTQLIARWRRL